MVKNIIIICLIFLLLVPTTETPTTTVQEIIENTTCDYIVKDVDTWSILEPTEYLNREVIEITDCEDTENTICIFIKLKENEKRIIKKA